MREKLRRSFVMLQDDPAKMSERLDKIVRECRGKISYKADGQIEAVLGNALMIRFFGTFFYHDVFGKPLPTIIKVKANGGNVHVELSDNLGFYLFNDPISRASYKKYFDELEKILSNRAS